MFHILMSSHPSTFSQFWMSYFLSYIYWWSSLLIMKSPIELVLPASLLNLPVECSLPCSSFYLPINFSLNGSVRLKKVLITLAKFVTNKIWHLSYYIKPSSYHVTSSLVLLHHRIVLRSSVNKVLSKLQNDIG